MRHTRQLKLLVISEDTGLVKSLLKCAGFRASHYSDPQRALERLKTGSFDAMIYDFDSIVNNHSLVIEKALDIIPGLIVLTSGLHNSLSSKTPFFKKPVNINRLADKLHKIKNPGVVK